MLLNKGSSYGEIIIPDIPNAYALDSDSIDSYYISQRYILYAIYKVINGENIIVTLYDTLDTRELLSIYSKIWPKEIFSMNIIWVDPKYYKPTEYISGLNLDWESYRKSHGKQQDFSFFGIKYSVKKKLILFLKDKKNIDIKSYCLTDHIEIISNYLKNLLGTVIDFNVPNDNDYKIITKLNGKNFLHQDLSGNRPILLSQDIINILPKGISVKEIEGIDGFNKAVDLLLGQGVNSFVIKPVNAASGEGICMVGLENIRDFILKYDFSFGDIIVEEFLDIKKVDIFDNGERTDLSMSIQFMNGVLLGDPVIQITKNNDYCGNLLNCYDAFGLTQEDINNIKFISQKLINELGLTGNGGFDFLIDNNYSIWLVDPNLGRDTGALPLRIFDKLYDNYGKKTLFIKVSCKCIYDISQFLSLLENNNIGTVGVNEGFDNQVLPISFVSGEHLTLIIRGSDFESIKLTYNKINEISNNKIIGENKSLHREILSAGNLIKY